MGMARKLCVHLLHQVEQITHHLKDVHALRSDMIFGACICRLTPATLLRSPSILSSISPPTVALRFCPTTKFKSGQSLGADHPPPLGLQLQVLEWKG